MPFRDKRNAVLRGMEFYQVKKRGMSNLRVRFVVNSVVILSVFALLLVGVVSSALAYSYPLQPDDTEIENALNYLREAQQSDGSIDGFAK